MRLATRRPESEQPPASARPADHAARPRTPGALHGWRGACALLAVPALLLGVRGFVAEPVTIEGESMTPTLHQGEQILVEKVSLHLDDVERGDIVLVDAPDGTLSIKRVVGVAGDRVAIRDGRLVVDGERQIESYSDPDDIDGVYAAPVTVAPDHVFLLGDHRRGSIDSRSYGAVPTSAIQGRALLRLWPIDTFGGIR